MIKPEVCSVLMQRDDLRIQVRITGSEIWFSLSELGFSNILRSQMNSGTLDPLV